MRSEDLTGLNPSLAKTEIGIFYDRAVEITRDFEEVEEVFMFNLHDEWYSPKANEFGTKYSLELFNVGNKVRVTLFDVSQKAKNAFNFLASSNGVSTIGEDFFSDGSLNKPQIATEAFSIRLNEMGPGGEVGMKVEAVKNTVSALKDGFDKLIAGLEDLPINISFYDPGDQIKMAYTEAVMKSVITVSELATSIYADIEGAIETETHLVEEAKNAASEEMSE